MRRFPLPRNLSSGGLRVLRHHRRKAPAPAKLPGRTIKTRRGPSSRRGFVETLDKREAYRYTGKPVSQRFCEVLVGSIPFFSLVRNFVGLRRSNHSLGK